MKSKNKSAAGASGGITIEFPFRHHAYCVEGDIKTLEFKILDFLEKTAGVAIKGNPDIYIAESETLSVEECRSIKARQSQQPLSGDKKYFLLVFNRITTEAANSLLKVLEEPSFGTHFFLAVPSRKILSQTVESRLEFIKLSADSGADSVLSDDSAAQEFLKSAIPERLAATKKIVEAISADKKTNADASQFVRSIERELRRSAKDWPEKVFSEAAAEILKTERYLSGRSPSVKILLDNLALVLPSTH